MLVAPPRLDSRSAKEVTLQHVVASPDEKFGILPGFDVLGDGQHIEMPRHREHRWSDPTAREGVQMRAAVPRFLIGLLLAVCATVQAADLDRLGAEVLDRGRHAVKGRTEPVQVYSLRDEPS